MIGGFKKLVHPGTLVSEVDLETSRAAREAVREEVAMREYLVWLLENSTPSDGLVRVTPYEVVSGVEVEPEPAA